MQVCVSKIEGVNFALKVHVHEQPNSKERLLNFLCLINTLGGIKAQVCFENGMHLNLLGKYNRQVLDNLPRASYIL